MAKKDEKDSAKCVSLVEEEGETSVFIEAGIDEKGNLVLSGQDVGKAPREVFGDSDYEYWLTISKKDKDRVLLALLETVYKGNAEAITQFQKFLKSKGISCEFASY